MAKIEKKGNKCFKQNKKVLTLIDQDYWHKLTVEEREYLNKFNDEYYNNGFNKKDSMFNKKFNGNIPKEIRSELFLVNNALRRDYVTLQKAVPFDRDARKIKKDMLSHFKNMLNNPNKANEMLNACEDLQETMNNLKEELRDTFTSNLDEDSKESFINDFILDIIELYKVAMIDKVDFKTLLK